MTDLAVPVRGHVRLRSWSPVSHGLHRPTPEPGALVQELAAWRLVLPAAATFTGLTSAMLRGWWLPPLPPDLPVFAAITEHDNRPRRAGLRVARHSRPVASEPIDGLPIAIPAETLLACSTVLRLLDVVVLTDAALHSGSCATDDIYEILGGRRRGSPVLRRALELADGRSESAWESMLRVLHVVCDVPVRPQRVLYDESGGFVARGDLHLLGTKTFHEYDGAEHRRKPRHRKDLARERRIGNEVWLRRGYTDVEVLSQAVSILRDADLSLGRPHRPERVRAWHALLADSLFTPGGRERSRQRLALPGRQTGHELHGSGTGRCSS